MYSDISGYAPKWIEDINWKRIGITYIIDNLIPGARLGTKFNNMRNITGLISDSLDITIMLGSQVEGAFGIDGTIGYYFVSDANGNQALQGYLGGGAGTPNLAISGTLSISTANSYTELEGLGFSFGGSSNFGSPYAIGFDYIVSPKGDDYNAPMGFTFSGGIGLLPYIEEHFYTTYTWTLIEFD
jgi:hypothetical protein